VTALHEDAMREAIAADGEAQRALLAGADAREPLGRAARAYRASWEAAPPRSFGRLVGYAKASILAGDDPAPYVREVLGGADGLPFAGSPAAAWAVALAALADGDDAVAARAAQGMRTGEDAPPFERAAAAVAALAAGDRDAYRGAAAAIVADFEDRAKHLTGVAIADTALVLERLAERRLMAVHPASPVLPAVSDERAVLTGTRVWAVVGCSPDPSRDSHRIAALLQRRGRRVIPVNPTVDGEILGERVYARLADVPLQVEVVDVFRRAELAGVHVDEAVAVGASAVWMQLGVIDHAAAGRGRAAGLRVVMDRCPAIELPRLGLD
jgi:uncharacterized protein